MSILWTGQKRPRNRTGLGSRPTPQTGTDSLKQDTEKTVLHVNVHYSHFNKSLNYGRSVLNSDLMKAESTHG